MTKKISLAKYNKLLIYWLEARHNSWDTIIWNINPRTKRFMPVSFYKQIPYSLWVCYTSIKTIKLDLVNEWIIF